MKALLDLKEIVVSRFPLVGWVEQAKLKESRCVDRAFDNIRSNYGYNRILDYDLCDVRSH
jgi:hypothetical protein